MKKSLIALATLAAATGAFAQSTVTLFGVVDTAITATKTGAAKSTAMTTSGLASSRIGFRGEEDLGGGLKAAFHMEAGVNTDSGAGAGTNTNNQATGGAITTDSIAKGGTATTQATNGTQGLTFNRRMTASLMGGFGEVRLGRDYTPHFWNHTVYDPFGTNGSGASVANNVNAGTNVTGVRASNSIGYLSPSFSGFKVQFQTYLGETSTPAAKAGSGNSLRATYDNGPVSVALATGNTTTGAGTEWKATNFGGSYDLGVAKVMALSSKDEITGSAEIKGFLVGATAPVGAGVAKIAFSNLKQGTATDTDKFAVGYAYSLSKRTSLYGTFAQTKPKTGDKTTGMDLGVSHAF